jgi:hypothetical protein
VVTKVPVLVREASFYADGLADEYVAYKLDEAKKAVVEKARYDVSRPDPVERTVFEYKDGREAAESLYESDGKLRSRRELGYDAAGRLASERMVDASGKALSSSSYAYDSAGRKVEWRAQDGAGGVKAVTSYAYGADGLGAVVMKDSGGSVTGSIKLEYAGGKLARRSYFSAGGALEKYESYSYSGELLSAVEVRRADSSLASRMAYEYGPLGQALKATSYGASGSATGYTTYEYVVREDSATETYYE